MLEASESSRKGKSSNIDPEFKQHLIDGNYVWFNSSYEVPPVYLKPNQFVSYFDLLEHLITLMPEDK